MTSALPTLQHDTAVHDGLYIPALLKNAGPGMTSGREERAGLQAAAFSPAGGPAYGHPAAGGSDRGTGLPGRRGETWR